LLEQYLDEILHWTRDSNLVARSDLGRLASRHVEESVAVLPLLDNLKGQRLIDVGSGAGFPAVPIAVFRPSLEVHAVESRHRKGLFLQRLVHVLVLSNLHVHVTRAESLALSTNERFDIATARAVAVVSELLPVLARLVRAGGHAVLFKGSSYEEERAAWITTRDPRWTGGDVSSVPDRHLHFLTFQRTTAE
jgi:16S rRNA (guanine527-N7)-methyltransferase